MWPREAFACREESGARLKRDAALGKREKSISSVVSSAKLPLCIFMAEEIHIRSVHRQLLPGCLRLSSQFPAKWPEKRHAPFQPTHSAVIRLMEAGVFTILCSALIFKEKKNSSASGGGDFSALNSTLAARDEQPLCFFLSIQNAPPKLAYLEDTARALCVCVCVYVLPIWLCFSKIKW
jgi:hypothetical protein